jgi:hypothetical protein
MSNTEPKHTRGPWCTCGWENIVVNSADDNSICVAAGSKYASLEELQANASLIAAAPDMLKALEDILYGNPKEAADKYEQGGCSDIWRNAITVVNKAKNIHQ